MLDIFNDIYSMDEVIWGVFGFFGGLFVGVYSKWFSHNLNLSRVKKKKKIELYHAFLEKRANMIEKSLRDIFFSPVRTEKEAVKLKSKMIIDLGDLEELKLFASQEILENVHRLKKALSEFYEVLIDLAILAENKKIRAFEVAYFLGSMSRDGRNGDRIKSIREDSSVDKDVLFFFEKYSTTQKNYFSNVIVPYTEIVELMRREIM